MRPAVLALATCVVVLASAGAVRSHDGGRAPSAPVDAGVSDGRVDVASPNADAATTDAAARGAEATRDGRFTLIEGEATRAQVAETVRAVVRNLNPGIRGTFGAELTRLLAVSDAVVIERVQGTARVRLGDRELTSPLDGSAQRQPGPGGRSVEVTHTLEGGVLVQRERTPNFVRTSRFSAEGQDVLVVTTSFRSPLLRAPIETVARYRRATP